jgi:hypothetical protein
MTNTKSDGFISSAANALVEKRGSSDVGAGIMTKKSEWHGNAHILRLITLKLSMRTPLMTQTRLEKKPKNVFIVKEFNGPTSGTPWHKTKTTTVVHFDSYYYY